MSSSKKSIFVSLASNCLIAIAKFIAGAITGSSAIVSEGVHSVVDMGNEIFLLYGLRRSKMPADEEFPFGHGKEIYFWSFIVAILIFASGAGVSILKGINHLIAPTPGKDLYVNYIIIGYAIIFDGTSWYISWKEFSKTKGKWGIMQAIHKSRDPSILAVFFENSADLFGLLVAFLGIFLSHVTGMSYFDGLASIIIGLILCGMATLLAFKSKDLLMGESANSEIVQGIREIINSFKEIEHVNEILTMQMGLDFILVNISVDFVDSISSAEVEATIAKMDWKIKQTYPDVKRIFVEAEEWRTKDVAGSQSEAYL